MWKLLLASALLLVLTMPAGSETKGKGRAACPSLKSVVVCNDRADCQWVVAVKGKGKGPTGKCVALKATPR